jgi:hypothetical protein
MQPLGVGEPQHEGDVKLVEEAIMVNLGGQSQHVPDHGARCPVIVRVIYVGY